MADEINSGTMSQRRPARGGLKDHLFYATDTEQLFLCDGDQWIEIFTSISGGVSQDDLDAAIAALVDSAPGTLDTLNELAAALGDDSNFAASVAAQIGDIDTRVTALEANPAGDEGYYEHFQSSQYSAGPGGVMFSNIIAPGQQGSVQYLNPNGSASWQNAIIADAEKSSLVQVEIALPTIRLVPPVDGSAFGYDRVATLDVDGVVDVYAVSERGIINDASKGAYYVPSARLSVNASLAPGVGKVAVIGDEITAWWEDNGGTAPLEIYPQVDRAHGYVTGRKV